MGLPRASEGPPGGLPGRRGGRGAVASKWPRTVPFSQTGLRLEVFLLDYLMGRVTDPPGSPHPACFAPPGGGRPTGEWVNSGGGKAWLGSHWANIGFPAHDRQQELRGEGSSQEREGRFDGQGRREGAADPPPLPTALETIM